MMHDERAFTLVEVAVVLLIIAVVAAVSVPTVMSTKKNAGRSDLISAARSYAGAIEAYELDHSGRVPQMNTADWPTSAIVSGPLNNTPGLTDAKRHYLRTTLPESITNGTVGFGLAPTTAQSIKYVPAANGTDYSLVVTYNKQACSIGMALPGTKAC